MKKVIDVGRRLNAEEGSWRLDECEARRSGCSPVNFIVYLADCTLLNIILKTVNAQFELSSRVSHHVARV